MTESFTEPAGAIRMGTINLDTSKDYLGAYKGVKLQRGPFNPFTDPNQFDSFQYAEGHSSVIQAIKALMRDPFIGFSAGYQFVRKKMIVKMYIYAVDSTVPEHSWQGNRNVKALRKESLEVVLRNLRTGWVNTGRQYGGLIFKVSASCGLLLPPLFRD
jgi:hypothetical protein